MATDADIEEFHRSLSGGWSLSRACAFALLMLRNGAARRPEEDGWKKLTERLPVNFLSWDSDLCKEALDLLMAEGLVVGEALADLTGKGLRVCDDLKRLGGPSGLVAASRELFLHRLYAAGRSDVVLRDAYWGSRQRKKYDKYNEPWFEPWLVFAGEVVSLDRFEEALGYLASVGLARTSLLKASRITDKGREVIESSPRTMWPGYLLETLEPQHAIRPREDSREPLGRSGEKPTVADQPSNRVTYVIQGNVSNLVGNTGNTGATTVNIANGVDIAALTAATEQLRALLPTLQLSPTDTAQSAELLDRISAQTAAPSPDRGRLHQTMAKLGGLIARSRGPLTEIAVGVVNEQLKRLTG